MRCRCSSLESLVAFGMVFVASSDALLCSRSWGQTILTLCNTPRAQKTFGQMEASLHSEPRLNGDVDRLVALAEGGS